MIKEFFDEDFWDLKGFHIAIVLFALLLIIICILGWKEEKKIWNDGFCECGGRWEYMTTSDHIFKTDSGYQIDKRYIYKCNKCGKMHEFGELR